MEAMYDVSFNTSTPSTPSASVEIKPTRASCTWWSSIRTTVSRFFKCDSHTAVDTVDLPATNAEPATPIDAQPSLHEAPTIARVSVDQSETSMISTSDLPPIPVGITTFKSASEAINALVPAYPLKAVSTPIRVSTQSVSMSSIFDSPVSLEVFTTPSTPSTPVSSVFDTLSIASSHSSLPYLSEVYEQDDKLIFYPSALIVYKPNPFIESFNQALKTSTEAKVPTVMVTVPSVSCFGIYKSFAPRQLSLRDFDVFAQIGAGVYGDVYLARRKASDVLVALKVICLIDEDEEEVEEEELGMRIQRMITEQQVLRSVVGEKDMLQLLGSWRDSRNFYLVTELCQNGDLSQMIEEYGRLPLRVIQFIMAHMILALEKLHSRRIIHHDIKPANILFDTAGYPRLADFGLSEQLAGDNEDCISEYSGSTIGTLRYLPPDLYLMQPQSFEKDIWALGVTVYEMLLGKVPFGSADMDLADIGHAIIQGEPVFPWPRNELHASVQDLLSQMLATDPESRLSLEEIKAHNFFADVDFTTVESGEMRMPTTVSNDITMGKVGSVCVPEGEPLDFGGDEDVFAYTGPEMAEGLLGDWAGLHPDYEPDSAGCYWCPL